MEQVGVRRFRDRLTHYLNRVRTGESFVITDRDAPVACLTPAGSEDVAALLSMMREGLVEWHGGKPRGAANPGCSRDGLVSDVVLEARR